MAVMTAFVAALSTACSSFEQPAPSIIAHADVLKEAQAFMDSYGADLRTGNRQAIAELYDRRGAYFLINGNKEFLSFQEIVNLYAGPKWTPPTSFEWQDLSYEAIGRDAVGIAGKFIASRPNRGPRTVSYTGLLLRQDGVLRIRLEDESVAPEKP
jgi:hypothetical protein